MQFVSYHFFANEDNSVPVATGETKEDCRASAITRVLSSGALVGEIATIERNDINPEIFKELKEKLDAFFAEHGIA